VRFSGGIGSDRADRQIAAYLHHLKSASAELLHVVVSADAEVRRCGHRSEAVVMTPAELGFLLS
jgi:hypothetical protein